MSSIAKHRLLQQLNQPGKLNLVSLMDIFTILVFFLMINSSEVKVVQDHKSIQLPDSTAQALPEATLNLMIGETHLFVQGQPIIQLTAINKDQDTVPALLKELNYHAQRKHKLNAEQSEQITIGLPITILGDHQVPYALLKKILTTCAQTDYRDIALAVNHLQQAPEEDS